MIDNTWTMSIEFRNRIIMVRFVSFHSLMEMYGSYPQIWPCRSPWWIKSLSCLSYIGLWCTVLSFYTSKCRRVCKVKQRVQFAALWPDFADKFEYSDSRNSSPVMSVQLRCRTWELRAFCRTKFQDSASFDGWLPHSEKYNDEIVRRHCRRSLFSPECNSFRQSSGVSSPIWYIITNCVYRQKYHEFYTVNHDCYRVNSRQDPETPFDSTTKRIVIKFVINRYNSIDVSFQLPK